MKTMSSLFAAVLLAAASASSWSQDATATPRVDKRQEQQSARIAEGAASGALTRRERHRLRHEQGAINRAENKAKADGGVTPQERRRLDRMQNKASRDIHRQKHDAQTARRPGVGASAAGK